MVRQQERRFKHKCQHERRCYVRERGRHDWASVYAQIGCRPGHPDYESRAALYDFCRSPFCRSPFGRMLIRGPFVLEQAYTEPLFPKLLFP